MLNSVKNDNVWSLLFTCFPRNNDIVTIDVMKKGFTDRAIDEAVRNGYIQHIGNSKQFNIPQYGITEDGIKFRDKK